MKKITLLFGSLFAVLILLVASFAMRAQAVVPPNWNATGNYVINMEYLGTQYAHDMSLTEDSSGNLTGSGGSPAGANVYTWVITSGSVSGDSIDFMANYTATADAVVPQTTLHVSGTIASDGTISGLWSDNYQGGSRSGAVSTVSGKATALRTLTVILSGTGTGIVTSVPVGIACGVDCTKVYNNNTSVTLTATAAPGSTFTGWSGACSGTGSCTLIMSANASATATFTANVIPLTHTITAGAGANGSISPSGLVVINDGNNQSFTITANAGFHVNAVLVDSVSVGPVSAYTFSNVNADHTISASFAASPVVIGPPTDMNQCKNNGWKTFTNPSFKNQGECVSYVNHHDGRGNDDEDSNENNNSDEKSEVEVHGNSQANVNESGLNLGLHLGIGLENSEQDDD